MDKWVFSLIYPTLPPFLVDVGHDHLHLKPNTYCPFSCPFEKITVEFPLCARANT